MEKEKPTQQEQPEPQPGPKEYDWMLSKEPVPTLDEILRRRSWLTHVSRPRRKKRSP